MKKELLAVFSGFPQHHFSEEITRRLRLHTDGPKCYLALIEEVEKYVRYEPDNPTYIRNTVDAREMYDMAFGIL